MKILKPMAAALLLGCSVGYAAGPVNINLADADTLARELNGVGAAKAMAIIEYRQANGPFRSIESLAEVGGIGPRILEINRERISVSADPQ